MATYSAAPFVNAAERLTDAKSLVTQTQADLAFSDMIVQQSILGHGDQQAARQLKSTVSQLVGLARQNEQMWTEIAKGDKDQFKKELEMIKKQ